ncbi:MAG: hypothetical protein IJ580_05525 [Prevotella sp.]|nr:hypothetical protein [Prevotella sp.]
MPENNDTPKDQQGIEESLNAIKALIVEEHAFLLRLEHRVKMMEMTMMSMPPSTDSHSSKTIRIKDNMKGKLVQLIHTTYESQWYEYSDGSPVSNIQDIVATIGGAIGYDNKNIWQKLNKVYNQGNYLEVFDELQQKAIQFKQKKDK